MKESLFQVDLTGVLKVLSDSLYSNWDVFLRELLQNAHDAIARRKQHEAFNPSIHLEFFEQADGRVLLMRDNGIGLTSDDMETFLSKIGASSKSDRYNLFDRNNEDFIGQFGIGLLSCFMVSEKIEVTSRAAAGSEVFKWTGRTNGTYQIESIESDMETGTIVRLEIKPDIPLDESKIRQLLHRYADYLPLPVWFSINVGAQELFDRKFPWEAQGMTDQALRFGKYALNDQFQFHFPIQDRSGKTQGMAYVLPHQTHAGSSSRHTVYIKHMYVSNQTEKLLPDWAFFVRVVVNSQNLATTASREEIYDNETLESVRHDLGESIKGYLVKLSQEDPRALQEILSIHGQALKSLALTDEGFFRFIVEWLVFPTSEGRLSLSEILKRTDKLLYVPDLDEYRQLLPIAKANDQLIINAGYIYDTSIFEAYAHIGAGGKMIQRVNAQFFGSILQDPDIEVYDRYRPLIESLQAMLMEFEVELDLKQFEPAELPAMCYMSQQNLQQRDLKQINDEAKDDWAGVTASLFDFSPTFRSQLFLNLKNPIVQKLFEVKQIKKLEPHVQMIYFNTLMMSHYPLTAKELACMNENLLTIIDQSLS
ncbi:HSP90 family protein [Pontibacter sp. G13]|uniref:HSP90 family protein n=1 Tax=Pontibacter sp. G13 TaxID=3074898 RepID=UPI00288ABCE1|nr:HSP90 family protein [Pontibacter sp. G13]WNJ18406.1 HSP90 family protein [Pontibacter sp. G13]